MKLPVKMQERIDSAIEALESDPRPSGAKKLKSERDLYRIRVGDHRIIYEIQDAVLVVLIVKVGKWGDVYR